jgi:hypothetical protein
MEGLRHIYRDLTFPCLCTVQPHRNFTNIPVKDSGRFKAVIGRIVSTSEFCSEIYQDK